MEVVMEVIMETVASEYDIQWYLNKYKIQNAMGETMIKWIIFEGYVQKIMINSFQKSRRAEVK